MVCFGRGCWNEVENLPTMTIDVLCLFSKASSPCHVESLFHPGSKRLKLDHSMIMSGAML